MKFAVDLPLMGVFANPRLVAEIASEAEQAGWDGFFVWDHVSFWGLAAADPWVTLSAIAMNTKKIKLGAMITPLPRRRPWKFARETTTLDQLSGGRLIVGVGIGGGGDEWDDVGEETVEKTRGLMLDEGLDIVTGLWRGEEVNHQSDYYLVKKKTFQPTPVQKPRIPVWVAGTWPGTKPFQRAARWDGVFPLGRGLNLNQMMTPDGITNVINYVKAYRPVELESQPFDVCHWGITPVDAGKAAEIAAPYAEVGVTWWQENISPWVYGWNWSFDPWPIEAMRLRIQAGPPRL